jgi:hypothetical protein
MQPPNTATEATDEPGPEFVSVRRTAETLGLSPYRVSQLLDEGVIESEYVRHRKVRWASVVAYMSGETP